MKHTLIAGCDKPGVLNQFPGRCAGAINIDSLQVSQRDAGHQPMPVVDGNERMVQVISQMRKVVAWRAEDISSKPSVVRELALIRVQTNAETRSDIVQMVNIYRGEVVDVALESMVVQIVGSEDRVDSLIELLNNFGIIEMVRTGRVAVVRGMTERKHRRSTAVWRARANGYENMDEERLTTGGV